MLSYRWINNIEFWFALHVMNWQCVWRFEYICVVRGTWWSQSEGPELDSSLCLCCGYFCWHVETLTSYGSEFVAWSDLCACIFCWQIESFVCAKLILCICEAYCLLPAVQGPLWDVHPLLLTIILSQGMTPHQEWILSLLVGLEARKVITDLSGSTRQTTTNTPVFFITY